MEQPGPLGTTAVLTPVFSGRVEPWQENLPKQKASGHVTEASGKLL